MVQLAMDHLFNLPAAESAAGTPTSPAARDEGASFDRHLRQAGGEQPPTNEPAARPAEHSRTTSTPSETAEQADPREPQTPRPSDSKTGAQQEDPAAGDVDDNGATGSADDESALSHHDVESTVDESNQTADSEDDGRPAADEVVLSAGDGGVPAVATETTRTPASAETPVASDADAPPDQAATPPATAAGVDGAVETITATAGEQDLTASMTGRQATGQQDLAASLTGGRAAGEETSDKSPDPTVALPGDGEGEIGVSEPNLAAADQEDRGSRPGSASIRPRRSGSKGAAAKGMSAVSPTDGDTDANVVMPADVATVADPDSVADSMAHTTTKHHEIAQPTPMGPAGAEPPAGTPRVGGPVPVAAAERLAEGTDAARSQTTETTQSTRDAVDTARFVQRVARAFLTGRVEAGREIRLRLHPPELGHLRLQIKVQDGGLTAHMETENPLARTLLLDHLAALRHRLAEHDIKIDRFDVDLMQQPPNGSDHHAAADSQADRRPTAPPRTGDRRAAVDPTPTEAVSRPPTPGDGQLNIVI